MYSFLLDLVRELNTLNDDNLADRVITNSDVQWCLSELQDILEAEQPTLTPQNEWVSVEERLPRVGGNYICAVQDKNGGTWTIPAEWNLEMKTWFGAFGEIKNKVTHWMPLPAPPGKEDQQ